jgi:hypothetical protein
MAKDFDAAKMQQVDREQETPLNAIFERDGVCPHGDCIAGLVVAPGHGVATKEDRVHDMLSDRLSEGPLRDHPILESAVG